jgi:hypothetical protein
MVEIIFFLIMGLIVAGAGVWSWRLDNGTSASNENNESSVSEKETEKEA